MFIRSLHGAIGTTGKVVGFWMAGNECFSGYLYVLRQVFEQHGVPREIYADRHAIFVSPKTDKLTLEEELEGIAVPNTRLGRALETLGVRFIVAGWGYTHVGSGERLSGHLCRADAQPEVCRVTRRRGKCLSARSRRNESVSVTGRKSIIPDSREQNFFQTCHTDPHSSC